MWVLVCTGLLPACSVESETINGHGTKLPWKSPLAWEGTGLPIANSTESRSKDKCSFKPFLLSFSCQLSVTGFAASYSLLFALIDSFPPYAELHCWKCTPFSDLLLQATSDILQLLLPQHSSPASLLCLWLSGGQHYRMFPCLAARLNPTSLQGLLGPVFLSFTQFNFLVPAENTNFFLLGIGPWQCSLLLRQCFPESCPWNEGKKEDQGPAACLSITYW